MKAGLRIPAATLAKYGWRYAQLDYGQVVCTRKQMVPSGHILSRYVDQSQQEQVSLLVWRTFCVVNIKLDQFLQRYAPVGGLLAARTPLTGLEGLMTYRTSQVQPEAIKGVRWTTYDCWYLATHLQVEANSYQHARDRVRQELGLPDTSLVIARRCHTGAKRQLELELAYEDTAGVSLDQ